MDIKLVLENHLKWLNNDGGERADLHEANLHEANLYGANLREADLREVNLYGTDLCGADLREANLYGADLRGADLRGADLRGANLYGADLRRADLRGANFDEKLLISYTSILPEGDLIGWKKCKDNIIVKLKIPSKAKRSNATGRKCRAEYVEVLEIIKAVVAFSKWNCNTKYKVGKTVKCDKWDSDRWNECSGGIHFFITKEEAERY